jgi:dTDP-4-dehydrorhamnose reductase
VDAVAHLIKASEENDAHLVHVSTDFIFDGNPNKRREKYLEDDHAHPVNYYGESKFAAEELVKLSNCRWAIVRTSLVYGIAESMSRTNIVLWAKGELEKGKKVNVVDDQFRSPTLAEDLAQACILIADKQADGVFHISGKDYMSIYEMVKQIAAFYNFDQSLISSVSTAALKQAAVRPPKTGFVIDKAVSVLGYHPHTFEEGIMILDHQLKTIK